MVTKHHMRELTADRWFNAVNIVLCVLMLILFVYPLYFIIIASVSDPNAVWGGNVYLWPKSFSLIGYKDIFTYPNLFTSYRNSIFYTVTGVIMSLLITLPAAFGLSRKEFMPGSVIMKLFVFTMYFSGGLIPSYMLIRNMGMLDTVWAILLPGTISVTNIIITRSFYISSIPEELREAAMLDGCGDLRYFISIVLPLSKAIIAVMALYYGINRWNAYFGALIYLKNRELFPLQLVLREILNRGTIEANNIDGDALEIIERMRIAEVGKYCSIIVASIPPMIIYPFVQKFFIKGVMIGSIKG